MPVPADSQLPNQWHLGNSELGQWDLDVFGVWNPYSGPAYTGAGVRVIVASDGFDYLHSDLAVNYNIYHDFDWTGGNDDDPCGDPGNSIGTALAGLIGAAANGTGAVGVASGSELVGYRVESSISDAWLGSIVDT